MKILQINKLYYPWIGGIETIARDIAMYFNKKDDIDLVNLVCQPQGKRKKDSVDGVVTHRASSMGIVKGMPVSIDFFFLFRKLVKETDLIFIHHPFPLAYIAYWLFGRDKEVVVWYHSDIVKQKFLRKLFDPFLRYTLKKATHVFVSNKTLLQTSHILPQFVEKCRVIYFGIDVDTFRKDSKREEESNTIIETYGTPLLLSVGRLVYYKGFSYLIEAMRDITAQLLIIGNGPLKDELSELIRKYNLEERVHIIDPVDDLVPYYHACDIFVLPSSESSEVFGIVQIEALACGKPVINTALPTGVPEVSVDGKTGLTVPPKDSEALSSAIRTLLEDRNMYQTYSENALTEVEKRFKKELFFSHLEKYLEI